MACLLDSLREAGAHEQAAALADRAAAHAALDNPDAVAGLLDSLREAGAHEQAAALADRAAAHAPLDNPVAVAFLLDSLRQAGGHEQAAALLARDPAAHAALDDPRAVAILLDRLQPARPPLDNSDGVAFLLGSLEAAGAHDQVTALASRLPMAGMFELFLKRQGREDEFRFGREADGSPAGPWGWEDLD